MKLFKKKNNLQIPVLFFNTHEKVVTDDNSNKLFTYSTSRKDRSFLSLPVKPICK